MILIWRNKVDKERTAEVSSIDDIECYEEDGLYCLRIRNDLLLAGGQLGKFKSKDSRDKAYSDIKEAIEEKCEELNFRPSFYER